MTFTDKTGWRISKKAAIAVATGVVAACVAVGLIVYYAGVANVCRHDVDGTDGAAEASGKPEEPTKPTKKTVTSLPMFGSSRALVETQMPHYSEVIGSIPAECRVLSSF